MAGNQYIVAAIENFPLDSQTYMRHLQQDAFEDINATSFSIVFLCFPSIISITVVTKSINVYCIQISSDLKPSSQCRRAAARANKILGCIRLAFKYLDLFSLASLYKALVLPILDYCSVAWCPYYTRDIEVLEKVQRRMTRILPGLKDLPYEERLRSLNLLTLFARRIKHDLIFVYKLFHGGINLDASKFFTVACERRTRGHSLKLQVNYSRLTVRKNFFSQRVISHWNDLPSECANAPSLSSFKFTLSQYFLQKGIH
ncbi:MAG: hypothetical protein AAGK05_15980 [Pseudomonadota bacterium]